MQHPSQHLVVAVHDEVAYSQVLDPSQHSVGVGHDPSMYGATHVENVPPVAPGHDQDKAETDLESDLIHLYSGNWSRRE